jgi:hypothetical protein
MGRIRRMVRIGGGYGQAGRAAQGLDAAHLQDADPGQDLRVGHQHEGELPDVGTGDVVVDGEVADSGCS